MISAVYVTIVMLFTCTHMQCRAGVGACPDTMDSSGTCTNDVTDVTGFVRDGQQCVAFTRPFTTSKSAHTLPGCIFQFSFV